MTSYPTPTGERILLSPPHMSGRERSYVDEVFATNFVAPAGPMLARFEEQFLEATRFPHAVAVASGTAALHLALRCLGVGPGDRVWAPTFTFIASIAPILYQGAEPVLFDCDPETWNIDLDLIEEELPKAAKSGVLPKAIIAVDLYGQPCDQDRLSRIAEPYGIAVIADSAESVGSLLNGRHAGIGATCAAFSFNGNKLLTTGGGGLLASSDKTLVEHARTLSQQARMPVPHYEHEEVGYNYRMSALNAAVGCGQLEVLGERVARRREIFDHYRRALGNMPGVRFLEEPQGARANRWLTALTLEEGPEPTLLVEALDREGIEARRLWKPMHMQKALKGVSFVGTGVSEKLFGCGICLPSGSSMSEAQLEYVAGKVQSLLI
ncbi:DegT/DnrJ/EryC1/StrS family aminotransferase [Tepidicaulis sp. LMO-SS28]|uniref:DegT/DnrJ/EryC1/StrS family aminotransferase n=1 Tax=Tepidicaulis sp. LMO-SS28 TaxID=3447455 RepID=UPI003EE2B19F